MRGKKLLAVFLLGVGLCFMPVLGYGLESKELMTHEEVITVLRKLKANGLQLFLLESRIDYIMRNPTRFLNVNFHCSEDELWDREFPDGVSTKNKVFIEIHDIRNVFSHKSGIALLEQFKKELETAYSFIVVFIRNMDANVVAKFHSKEGIPLGYFYQGEYHLWEK